MGGLTRWVRPPLPWRPSKLRLDVEAHRSPGDRMSGFIPRHMEQPATRQSKPASLNIRSSPSASAWALTRAEPRHHHGVNVRVHFAALDHLGGGPQVLQARVGAGADEHPVQLNLGNRGVGFQIHVGQRPFPPPPAGPARHRRRDRVPGRSPWPPCPG